MSQVRQPHKIRAYNNRPIINALNRLYNKHLGWYYVT